MRLKPRQFHKPRSGHSDRPISDWMLNEGDGSVVNDLSGNSNNIVLTNGPTWQAGNHGIAVDFEKGSSQYGVTVTPTNLSPATFTVEAYVKLESFASGSSPDYHHAICAKHSNGSGTGGRWLFAVMGGGGELNPVIHQKRLLFAIVFSGGRTELFGTQQLELDRWYHLCASYDGVYMRTWIDGVLDNSLAESRPMASLEDFIWIGRQDGGSFSYYWDGLISYVRVYGQALFASSISQLYINPYARFAHDPIELWAPATQGGAPGGPAVPVMAYHYKQAGGM